MKGHSSTITNSPYNATVGRVHSPPRSDNAAVSPGAPISTAYNLPLAFSPLTAKHQTCASTTPENTKHQQLPNRDTETLSEEVSDQKELIFNTLVNPIRILHTNATNENTKPYGGGHRYSDMQHELQYSDLASPVPQRQQHPYWPPFDSCQNHIK